MVGTGAGYSPCRHGGWEALVVAVVAAWVCHRLVESTAVLPSSLEP